MDSHSLIADVNLVDIGAFVFIAVSIVLGARHGLSGELAGAISYLPGLAVVVLCFAPLSDWMADNAGLSWEVSGVLSFAAVILAALAVKLVFRIMLKKMLKAAIEKNADSWGGALSGLVKSAVVTAVFFMAMALLPGSGLRRVFCEESLIGSVLSRAVPSVRDGIAEHVDGSEGFIRLSDGE